MSNISYLAIKTIIYFEIKEYLKEFQFTIIAPLTTTILFVFILSTLDKYYSFINTDNSYIHFLVPGVVLSVVIQSSFNHLSEIIINMKQIGSFNDFLISPINRIELFFSLLLSSIFVNILVGIINLFVLSFFINFESINYISLFYYLTICILIFSSLGALTGFLSFTWDIQSSISTFFIVPISFLSGTFFSIDIINEKFIFLFKYNPIYHLVSGFRSSLNNNFYEVDIYSNIYIIIFLFIIILISLFVFNKGYRVIN